MESLLWSLFALAASLVVAHGQSISPSNGSRPIATNGNDSFTLLVSVDTSMKQIAPLLPLTYPATSMFPPAGVSGLAFLANATSEINIGTSDIAFISCDPAAGNIQPSDVFSSAETNNAAGVVFYSVQSEWCSLGNYEGTFPWIYSMKSTNDTMAMLVAVQTPDEARNGQVYATIMYGSDNLVLNATGGSGSNGTNSTAGASSSGPENGGGIDGPSPGTAVAMIILYSITGIITALFLVIIITGAVRAHRHPERYGPRNIVGRSRQSRARGLARAMLDTLPIVKFAEREEFKPAELELGEGARTTRTDTEQAAGRPRDVDGSNADAEQQASGANGNDGQRTSEGGIAAALPGDRQRPVSVKPNSQGCSICTEDFESGQDIRVLPCDHRFHPACIDPWLLNVSGTCPLCRHDLRPESEREGSHEHDREFDEFGAPVLREGQADLEMAPPLAVMDGAGSPERAGIRRSITLSIMNIGRPDRASREERILALRNLRVQSLARRRREEEAAVAETAEEQSRTGRVLRNLLNRNSRRVDGREQVAPPQQIAPSGQARAAEEEHTTSNPAAETGQGDYGSHDARTDNA